MKEGGFTDTEKRSDDKDCDTSAVSRLQKIYEMAEALKRPMDVQEICVNTLEFLFRFFEEIDNCAIFAVDRDLGLKEIAVRSRRGRRLGEAPFSQTMINRVLRAETPVIIPPEHEEGETGREICIPLAGKLGVHGAVCLRFSDEGRSFQEEDFRFVAAMSIPAALGLENAYLLSTRTLLEEEVKKAREDLEKQISERTAELTQANRQLQELSITDELTGLYNHRHLVRTLESEFKRAVRYKRNFTLLMVDVDFFKQVNDSYGHRCGDLVLRELARIFKKDRACNGCRSKIWRGRTGGRASGDSKRDGPQDL